MKKKTIIHQFNLLNNQNAQYKAMFSKIQQILYYAESRFWSILITLAAANNSKRYWCQKLLHRELVFNTLIN